MSYIIRNITFYLKIFVFIFTSLLVVIINIIDSDSKEEDWTASSILASVNLKSSVCSYSYSIRIKKLLYMPSMFAKVNLYVQSHFRSSFGLELYENCIRFQGLPMTGWFDISLFRKMMGVSPDQYLIFRDFKKRVLDKAVYEVNTFSNIIIEPELFRKAKQVVKIRFHLKERAKKKALGNKINENLSGKESEIAEILSTEYKIKDKKVKEILANHKLDYISEKIALVENSKKFKQGKVSNVSGLLIAAIDSDYKPRDTVSLMQPRLVKKERNLEVEKQREIDLKQFEKYLKAAVVTKFQDLAD